MSQENNTIVADVTTPSHSEKATGGFREATECGCGPTKGSESPLATGVWRGVLALVLILSVIAIDQVIKIAVKTGMYMHQSIRVTDWFYLLFTENNGMAFGWEFFDKFLLTSFRIIFVIFIAIYMVRAIRRGISWGYLICLSLIVAGAAGNIVDCVFYGLIFNNPPAPMVADFVSFGTGYGTLFNGRVVDMFYFPLVEWNWPTWMPLCGGNHFIFFSPIFNFADAAISCGIVALLLFFRKNLELK